MRHTLHILVSLSTCFILLCSCSTKSTISAADPQLQPPAPELVAALQSEFERLGIDPDKVAAAAPTGEDNRVFQIQGVNADPDGPVGPLPGQVVLIWVERFNGDYDQNGEVNIADLTPLGLRFQDNVTYRPPVYDGMVYWPSGEHFDDGGTDWPDPPVAGSPAENWRLARVDGDANGEINIADITPIAQHWNERATGWRVYRRLESDPEYTMWPNTVNPTLPYTYGRDQAATAHGGVLDANRPPTFVHLDIFQPGFTWIRYYVAPYDAQSDQEGPASPVVELHADNNPLLLPVAVLEPTPAAGPAPLTVHWYAGASYDLDGTLTGFMWDTNYDGTFETDTGPTPSVDVTYDIEGPQAMTVRVTDNDGLTQTATVTVQVGDNELPSAEFSVDQADGWVPLEVSFDPTASSDDGSITMLNWDLDGDGNTDRSDPVPTVFQHQYTVPGVYEVELTVTDDKGATDSVTHTITAHGWVTTNITAVNQSLLCFSAAIIDGHPAVAWTQQNSSDLLSVQYTRAMDYLGEDWSAGIIQVRATPDNVGSEGGCSMAEINSRPAIIFSDTFTGVEYIRAENSTGSAWPLTPVNIYLTNNYKYMSLAEVEGRPAAAWLGTEGTNHLLYCRADDAEGSSWPMRQDIDSGNCGYAPTLVPFETGSGEIPLIAHLGADGMPWFFKFDYGLDSDGSSWGPQQQVDLPDDDSIGLSLAVVDGQACLAYGSNDSESEGLTFWRSSYDSGSGFDWSGAPVVMGDSYDGIKCSLAVVGGLPAIAYFDRGDGWNTRLMYVQATDAQGTAWGTPSVVQAETEDVDMLYVLLFDLYGQPGIAHARRPDAYDHRLRFSHAY